LELAEYLKLAIFGTDEIVVPEYQPKRNLFIF
jgi:hypothetical protein